MASKALAAVLIGTAALLLGGCSSALCPPGSKIASNPGTYGVWQCVEEKD